MPDDKLRAPDSAALYDFIAPLERFSSSIGFFLRFAVFMFKISVRYAFSPLAHDFLQAARSLKALGISPVIAACPAHALKAGKPSSLCSITSASGNPPHLQIKVAEGRVQHHVVISGVLILLQDRALTLPQWFSDSSIIFFSPSINGKGRSLTAPNPHKLKSWS